MSPALGPRSEERDPAAHEGDWITSDGVRWRVQRSGSGPVALLIHGTGASGYSFRHLARRLAAAFTVVVPDLPGHAATVSPPSFRPALPDMARAVSGLMDRMDLSPTLLIGHSAGAAILAQASLAGALAPKLLVGIGAALVPFRGVARSVMPRAASFLASASRHVRLRVRDTRIVDLLARSTGSRLDPDGLEEYARLAGSPNHVAATLDMMANWDLEPLFDDLPRLDVPVLLVAGRDDRAVPLPHQYRASARLPAASVSVIEGAGHLVHEERPGRVADLVERHARAIGILAR